MSPVIVLTTLPAAADAVAFARTLLTERLVACVHLPPPMQSVYRWEGALQLEDERQLVMKTCRDRVPALEARLLALHPYDVPEFVVIDVAATSHAYGAWVAAETRGE